MAERDQLLNLIPSSLRRPLRDLLDIAKPASATAASLTDSTTETADQTIAKVDTAVTGVDGTGNNAASKADVDNRLDLINKNFADLTDEINKLITDVASLRTKLSGLTG